MARPSPDYRPRRPEQSALYQLVRDHVETFRAQSACLREGEGLPRFVDDEFRSYLRCGWLAGGFARFRCAGCGTDRLVPFSCKGRGFCPSCGPSTLLRAIPSTVEGWGRRMAERTAHLVDDVFPPVAVRQWVLSLPPRIRYLLAWDHEVCRAVVAVYVRAVLGFLRARAGRAGVPDGRGGAVVIVQRFGAALNLNVHVHALVLDGVFAQAGDGTVVFHPAPPLADGDVVAVLEIVRRRIERLLDRRGLTQEDESDRGQDVWMEEAPVLAGIAAASVQGLVALGPRAGARVRRLGDPPDEPAADAITCYHARQRGFDVHAGVVAPAGHRERLARLCRYALRPPIAEERLSLTQDGKALLALRHRWSDGTTHLLFEPLELLERLAVITPRPRVNLILYHGVLGPRAAWRAHVVGGYSPGQDTNRGAVDHHATPGDGCPPNRHGVASRAWADLMRRSFGYDVLACPRCGARLRLIAVIERAAVVERILRHLGLPIEIPPPAPARAPPDPFEERRVLYVDGGFPGDCASVAAC